MQSLFNLERESHKAHQKTIEEHITKIKAWTMANASNANEVEDFIKKYLHHLTNETKQSMFTHILNIADARCLKNK